MNRRILNIAIPNIISNITIPLLGIVDLSLVGHLESKVYIGAIALGSMIFNFIYWGFSFLRMGTSGFTAQSFGRRDLKESFQLLYRALFVGLAGAMALLILQKPIEWLSFFIISGSEEVEFFAREYFYIRIWAAPATIALYSITGWFIGMQNAKIPMFIAITVNLLNIVFNVTLIRFFGMKSDGVALGTVMAQYSGLIVASLFVLQHKKRLIKYLRIQEIIQLEKLKIFFRVNKDILIRTLSLVFTLSFFTAKSAKYGDTLLAVNTLLLQFFTIYAYIVDGFAYAGEALAGKYFGAKDKSRLIKVSKLLFFWGLFMAGIFTFVYFFGDGLLLSIFTDNAEVIQSVQPYLIWVYLIPVLTFGAFIWDGIFIGVTASASMRNAMLISAFAIFLPAYFILHHFFQNHGLWAAFMLFMLARVVTLSWFAPKKIYQKLS
ncbi:MAG: MATE family efflux transporter [Bacteroidales bacterium]|jgi:MATE family multidrug resistance protein|nr:MATE family efflux transporter [Bacteroidales bacterium]